MNIETNKKKKQIAILGSTGSIGTQALQVIEEHFLVKWDMMM